MSQSAGILDLQNPPPGHSYSVSIEQKESVAERNVRLFKDVVLFLVALGFVMLIVGLCLQTLRAASASTDEKKWAMSVLSAAAGGILGYLIRK